MIQIPEDILLLIIARHRRTLTEEEELGLQTWLQENAEHQEEMERIQQVIEDYALSELQHCLDQQRAWEKVDRQTSPMAAWKKYRIVRLWRNIAAVLLPFLVLGGGLFWLSRNMPDEISLVTKENIEPGRAQAELVLAGGKKIVLKNTSQQKIVDGQGEVVGIDSVNKLVYISQAKEIAEWNTLSIPNGGEYQLILPDGTKVWLNSNTKLKFPDQFIGRERQVELEGEAFFEVTRDTAHPFRVKTAHSEIRVLGTSFNVSCYLNEEIEQTTLVEGKVEVVAAGQVAELRPGKQLQLNVKTRVVDIKEVDVSLYSSWKDGIFRFCDLPLEELVLKLERWYNVHFFFMQTDCREVRFTGAIRKYADFQEFIRLIESTTDVKFDINGSSITIQKK